MEVQAECPWCGMVTLRPKEVRCEVDPRTDEALCEINCPVCHRVVYAKTTHEGVRIIRAAGAVGIAGLVPFELLERRSGPPLLWDEVLDVLADSPISVPARSKRPRIESGDYPPNFKVSLAHKDASLVGDLPFNPLQWGVISSSISRKDGTMATLYGNDLAVRAARARIQAGYPKGSALSLVTWCEQPDSHWFGARIPGLVKSVEFVMIDADSLQLPSYLEFKGSPLRKVASDAGAAESRVAYILGQRASAMP